jgi:hypothetical protein
MLHSVTRRTILQTLLLSLASGAEEIGETRKLTMATASGRTEIDAPVLDFS